MKKKFCLALVFASALTAAACGIGNRSSEKPDGINENGVLESLSELFDEDTDQIQESAGAAESDIPAEETENREDGEEFSYAHVEAPNILMGDNNQGEYENYVLGSEIERDQISSVTVLDTLSDISDMSWDVSANKDGSVMAWVTADPDESGFYDLFIAGEGGVKANPDCRYLFAGYENAESINFHDCFDTSDVTTMAYMFYNCKKAKQIDVSGFDTSDVTDMSSMFRSCTSLETVDLSGFDTSNVNNFVMMFYGCGNLVSVGIDGLYIREGADTTDMYTGTRWQ